MGFNIKTSELLILSQQAKINYEQTVTIGRQQLNGSQILFEKLFNKYSLPQDAYQNIFRKEARYCESFLKLLGAKVIDSIDASDYEQATLIHDMNNPIADVHKNKYSVVIDSGSLEHIFNYPIAIKNCMEMVREGGHFIGISPANNFLGHGFYQFSPELFYRVFSSVNGFLPIKMLLYFDEYLSPVYEVVDPMSVRDRVKLKNTKESYLFFVAKRVVVKPVLLSPPQQSDYEHISWTNAKKKDTSILKSKLSRRIQSFIPGFLTLSFLTLRKSYYHIVSLLRPTGNGSSKYFKRVKQDMDMFNI